MNVGVKYEWDFGDGTTSNLIHPYHIYKSPGIYTVRVDVTFKDGTTVRAERENYIKVYSVAESIIVDGSSDKNRCLVYGTDKTNETGWSLFTGNDWIIPETKHAIVDIELEGDLFQVAFDNNGRPFIISDVNKPTYKDKIGYQLLNEHGQPTGVRHDGTDISCYVITPEYVGENASYRLTHEQTFFRMSPPSKTESFFDNTRISSQLIHDGSIFYEQQIPCSDKNVEQMFSIKKRADRVQVGFKTTTSGIRISDIETSLRVCDVARNSSRGATVDFGFQMFIMSPLHWFSIEDYSFDLGTQERMELSGERVPGVDNKSDTAFFLYVDMIVPTVGGSCISFFSKSFTPENVLFEKEIDDYTFFVVSLDVEEYIFYQGVTVYDIRVMQDTLTDLSLYEDYIFDIVENNGIKFLPHGVI